MKKLKISKSSKKKSSSSWFDIDADAEFLMIFMLIYYLFKLMFFPFRFLYRLLFVKQRYIYLNSDFFVVKSKRIKTTHKYSDVDFFKIHFNNETTSLTTDKYKLPAIEYKFDGETEIFYLEESKRGILGSIKYLYKNKVKFKEYFNGCRTYLLKIIEYKEFQEVKEKHNIEW